MKNVKIITDVKFPDIKLIKKGTIVILFKSQFDNEYLLSYKDETLCSLTEAIGCGYIKQTKSLNQYLPKGFHI